MRLSPVLLGIAIFANIILAALDGRARHHPARFRPFKSFNTFGTENNYDWAGGVLLPIEGKPYSEVESQFTVPAITAPTTSDGYWATSVWVGIDGYDSQTAILQSGVTLEIKVTGGVVTTTFLPWYEWYPDPPVYVGDDIRINAGDEILIQVKATSPSVGEVVIDNISTSTRKSYTINAPGNSILSGYNVEWIVESFVLNSGTRPPLPNFGIFSFSVCRALAGGPPLGVGGAQLLDIITHSGDVLTESSLPDDNTVQVKYLASI